MKKINFGQKDTIHFIGVGGIGMSGLAQIMKNMGFKVQGSDQNKNKNTTSCSKSGIKVFIGHSSKNIKNATIVVKSSAIKNNNNELRYARKNKIPISRCRSKLILRILLFLQFAGCFFVYLNVYDYFPMIKFPQQVHSA